MILILAWVLAGGGEDCFLYAPSGRGGISV